jgi:hypothetical protein
MICAAVERCAGIDVGKKWLSICIMIGALDGRRSLDCLRTARRSHIGHARQQPRFRPGSATRLPRYKNQNAPALKSRHRRGRVPRGWALRCKDRALQC